MIAGALIALPLAIAFGILANRVVLRGASILDARSLLLDVVAVALAGLAGIAVGRRVARALERRPLPKLFRLGSVAIMAALFLAGVLLPRLVRTTPPPVPAPPPIVLVSIDTLRPDRLSGGGDPSPTSPEIDRLLREGTFFVDATTPSPGSAPSHASLLTSRYPVSHGVFTNFTVLDDEVETLSETLAARGYRTAGFVTNTFLGRRFGFDQGFDVYVESGIVERVECASPSVLARSLAIVQILDRVRARSRPGYDPSFETMLRFLDEGAEPLFLFVHIMDVHSPYAPPPPWGPRFGARPEGAQVEGTAGSSARRRNRFGWRPSEEAYSAEIRFADEKIGRLRRALERRGLLGRAIVVLSSDHGENLLDHEPHFSHGRTLYDATLRILLALRGSGVGPGRLSSELVENVDVLPALAGILNETPHGDWEGRAPGSPGAAPRRFAVAQLQRDFAIRTRAEKIVVPEEGDAVRFDRHTDPGERSPLALSAEDAVRVRADLGEWITRHATPLYTRAPRAVRPDELSAETLEKLRALGYVE
jgi:arylsulfatase